MYNSIEELSTISEDSAAKLDLKVNYLLKKTGL